MEAPLFKVQVRDGAGKLTRRTECMRQREALRLVDELLAEGLESEVLPTRCDAGRRRRCGRRPMTLLRCPL